MSRHPERSEDLLRMMHGASNRGRSLADARDDERHKAYVNASSQVPRVEAREYSVARFSKKFVCSTAFSM